MRTVTEAIRWASAPRRRFGGMCLSHVRQTWGVGPRYSNAITAWRRNTRQRREHWSKAPLGASLFWGPHGSPHGHIATVVKTGPDARIATTDSRSPTTRIYSAATFERVGYVYLGWSDEVNGVVHPVGTGRPVAQKAKAGVLAPPPTQSLSINRAAVKRLQRVLGVPVDGFLSKPRSETIAALQRKAGTTADGVLSDPSELGKKLQRYLNGLRSKSARRFFDLKVDGQVDGPATTAALERYLLDLGGRFTNLHKA
jgi:hypothetical protein